MSQKVSAKAPVTSVSAQTANWNGQEGISSGIEAELVGLDENPINGQNRIT